MIQKSKKIEEKSDGLNQVIRLRDSGKKKKKILRLRNKNNLKQKWAKGNYLVKTPLLRRNKQNSQDKIGNS